VGPPFLDNNHAALDNSVLCWNLKNVKSKGVGKIVILPPVMFLGHITAKCISSRFVSFILFIFILFVFVTQRDGAR
jgi:hypothetical protein